MNISLNGHDFFHVSFVVFLLVPVFACASVLPYYVVNKDEYYIRSMERNASWLKSKFSMTVDAVLMCQRYNQTITWGSHKM